MRKETASTQEKVTIAQFAKIFKKDHPALNLRLGTEVVIHQLGKLKQQIY